MLAPKVVSTFQHLCGLLCWSRECTAAHAPCMWVHVGAWGLWLSRHQSTLPIGLPLHLQALWRGHKVRKQCGRAGRDARRRLAAVAAAAEAAPQRRIGVRTREALDVLLASRQCSQVSSTYSGLRRGVFCRPAISILCLLPGRWCMKADYGRVLLCLSLG